MVKQVDKMDVVSTNIHQQTTGLVVPVDGASADNGHPVPYGGQTQQTLRVPGLPGSRRMSTSGSQHKLIGGSDEHHILTTPLGQQAAHNAAMAHKPNISAIMNEYVGACFEENCNIGKPASIWIRSICRLKCLTLSPSLRRKRGWNADCIVTSSNVDVRVKLSQSHFCHFFWEKEGEAAGGFVPGDSSW